MKSTLDESGLVRSKPSIVVAHDYLTQRGGAERVVIELAKALDPEYIATAIYEPEANFPEFGALRIRASFLSRFISFRRDPRRALPFLPFAWGRFKGCKADIVFCSSSGWSHGIRVPERTRKIVYCHNPPRWLYQTSDYLQGQSFVVRVALHALRPFLLAWDRQAARKVDLYIANSSSVAGRIKEAYGRDAVLLYPPVSIEQNGPKQPIEGVSQPFFLTVGRDRGYKGTEMLIEAFESLPTKRLVVVGSRPENSRANNIMNVGRVSDAELRWLYSHASALISVSREDFGLTPIEANAFGTPVLLLKAGGFLDSTAEGISGQFIEELSVDCIRKAILSFPTHWDKQAILQHAEKFNSHSFRKSIQDIVSSVVATA